MKKLIKSSYLPTQMNNKLVQIVDVSIRSASTIPDPITLGFPFEVPFDEVDQVALIALEEKNIVAGEHDDFIYEARKDAKGALVKVYAKINWAPKVKQLLEENKGLNNYLESLRETKGSTLPLDQLLPSWNIEFAFSKNRQVYEIPEAESIRLYSAIEEGNIVMDLVIRESVAAGREAPPIIHTFSSRHKMIVLPRYCHIPGEIIKIKYKN